VNHLNKPIANRKRLVGLIVSDGLRFQVPIRRTAARARKRIILLFAAHPSRMSHARKLLGLAHECGFRSRCALRDFSRLFTKPFLQIGPMLWRVQREISVFL
jgi:hypothetical protein